jgi:putative ABC transport system permease protein
VIRFLLKGLWRDRTRSLFPFLTVVIGVTLTVLFQTYLTGLAANVSQSAATFTTGHVRVTSRAYAREADLAPNELALADASALLARLRTDAPALIWTPRIRFGGLLDVPDERGNTAAQAPVSGLGLGLRSADSPDRRLLSLDESIVSGRMPAAPGEILVSDQLARRLGVGPGAKATLIGSTMNGAMATENFTIAGTVRFGIMALDRGTILADLADVQRALDMDDAVGEMLGVFPDLLYRERASAIAGGLNTRWGEARDQFAPLAMSMRDQPGATELFDYYGTAAGAVIFVFTLVMSIVLWNSGLIASLRRYGEIGLRLAYGEAKGRLYRMMLVESLAIGVAGASVGTLLALGPAYWLQTVGLDIGAFMPNSSLMMNDVVRAQVTPTSLFIGFLPGVVATVVGTAISGIGIYKRQTSTLMRELEA